MAVEKPRIVGRLVLVVCGDLVVAHSLSPVVHRPCPELMCIEVPSEMEQSSSTPESAAETTEEKAQSTFVHSSFTASCFV